jgi:hypothetical protein
MKASSVGKHGRSCAAAYNSNPDQTSQPMPTQQAAEQARRPWHSGSDMLRCTHSTPHISYVCAVWTQQGGTSPGVTFAAAATWHSPHGALRSKLVLPSLVVALPILILGNHDPT